MELEVKVRDLIEKIVSAENIKIHSVSYLREDHNNYLRITIDKDPYVDIDDCVKVSKIINPVLDKADLIKETYILDVCSCEKGGEK